MRSKVQVCLSSDYEELDSHWEWMSVWVTGRADLISVSSAYHAWQCLEQKQDYGLLDFVYFNTGILDKKKKLPVQFQVQHRINTAQ